MRPTAAAVLLLFAAAPACGQQPATTGRPSPDSAVDGVRLLSDLGALAADSMEGRRTGTPGNERARRWLEAAFAEAGLEPLGGSFRHAFPVQGAGAGDEVVEGINLVGRVRGRDTTRVIVVTAHYDHLGRRGEEIFNGADDNASGVVALLSLARSFVAERPAHTVVFAALDAEEMGLQGARAFVATPPVPLPLIAANVNLDMVSRSAAGELWAAGTRHYPSLLPLVERVAAGAPVTLRAGHDVPGSGSDDWTDASDHGPFHGAGIPFLYFGVEDHPDYHRPSDDPERVDPDFFRRSVQTIHTAVRTLDRELDRLVPPRR